MEKFPGNQPVARLIPAEHHKHHDRAQDLGEYRRNGSPLRSHLKPRHKKKIQRNIGKAAYDQKI